MNKTWKVVFTFSCVFLAGAVAGGFTYARFARTVVESRIRAEQFAATYLKRLEENLDLTPTQIAKIKPVIEATGEELGKMRRETVAAFQRLETAVMKELTPDQRDKFEEMQRRMRERRDRPPGGPPPPHPPPPAAN